MKAEKEQIVVDMNNDYLKAVIKSFHQFLIEEATGAMNADLRLEEKLKAARTLFEQIGRASCRERECRYV